MELRFFDDSPVEDVADGADLLGRSRYADHAVAVLDRVKEQSQSSVIGLIGAWGSGKSSLLNMVTQRLKHEKSRAWSVAILNPWLYSDIESLIQGLFKELREALPRDKRWSRLKVRERLGHFGMAVSPIGAVTRLVGVDSSGMIHSLAERLAGEQSVSQAKKRVEEALSSINHPILVVMDDLDRLTPDELLIVFKLIRLVGNLPNVHYLISFDERTLIDALSSSPLVKGHDRAREFLEKIVQVRLDLPTFRERDLRRLAESYLQLVLDSNNMHSRDIDPDRFTNLYFGTLQWRLHTPRSLKRYFAQVDASLSLVANDVDLVDFLTITFLRTFEAGVYRMIVRYQAELVGKPSQSLYANADPETEAKKAIWLKRLADSGVMPENSDGILSALTSLFPRLAGEVGRSLVGGDDQGHPARVSSADYFDRYFVFGVPEDDLPEDVVDKAIEQLSSGIEGAEVSQFVSQLRRDPLRMIRRIGVRRKAGFPADKILKVLGENSTLLENLTEGGLGLLDTDRSVRQIAMKLLSDIPITDRTPAIAAMCASLPGTSLAGLLLCRSKSVSQDEVWFIGARDIVLREARKNLEYAATRDSTNLTSSERELLTIWRHLDSTGVREWLQGKVADGTWTLLAVLTLLAPTSTVVGSDTERLADFEPGYIEEYLGLGFVLDNLTESSTDNAPFEDPYSIEATPDMRLRHMLAEIERLRRADDSEA